MFLHNVHHLSIHEQVIANDVKCPYSASVPNNQPMNIHEQVVNGVSALILTVFLITIL